MTRKYTSPPMELDLDVFLQSHDTSASDDEDHHHQSTVDELLLIDSDDSSPPSSPPSYLDASSSNDANSLDSSRLTASQLVTDRDRPTVQSKYRSMSGINSGSVSRQLPSLFTPIRSSTKPGAALAAAEAASRLIPTPHAAAIKLTREKSNTESLDLKASIDSELCYESGTGSEISHSDEKSVEENLKPDLLEAKLCEELTTQHESRNGWSEDFPVAADASGFDLDSCVAKAETVSPSILDKDGTKSVLGDISNENASTPLSPDMDFKEDTQLDSENRNGRSKDFPVAADVSGFDLDSVVAKAETGSPLILDRDGTKSVLGDSSNENISTLPYPDMDSKEDTPLDSENTKIDEKDEAEVCVDTCQGSALEFAEELEKKHAFTGLHWEEGAAAQPMKLEGAKTGSAMLAYFNTSTDNTITRTISSPAFRRDHGTPQALAVHLNYIAVGMSRGLIVVVPSRYSPHYADNMDAKMLMLGLQGDRSYAPVTSMSFDQQGELLFAGYADGHYTVWNVQRLTAAKTVAEHKAPVVHLLYLGMDSQVTRQFNIISGDSKGVVKLIRFSPFSWFSKFSTSKTSTLLDESTSTVVCASPLIPEGTPASSSNTESTKGGELTFAEEGVVIFVTHQSALVAKVISDKPEVYAQLPRPDGVREGSMPYAAWKYIQGSSIGNAHGIESETVSLLAIAWDHQVQLAKLVKSELKIYAKWTLDSSAIGIAWLDHQMLVVLTSTAKLCLYANDGTLIHDTSFGVDGDDVIGHHTHFSGGKAHHNCIAVRGASLYLLGSTHLVVSRLLPWKERIEVLRRGGDWMGAFNMAMMLYDGQAHAVFDLPRALDDVHKVIMPYLADLLLAYVDEVFSYISVLKATASEQYTRVGGVAVEFCVHIKRTDILFDQVLARFESVQQKETFLELLEPYILKDMLGSLPPEIMQALVEHYSTKGWLQRVEQCVLHMDISSLDFNQVVRLCQEHNLYRALIYLFNKGLDDFKTPLEELLLVFTNSDSDNVPSLGYRMLVYLKYCFSGFAFPPGHGVLSPARLPSLRRELIYLLLEDSNAAANLSAIKPYKNLYHLLELDTEATLDVLRCAFIDEMDSTSQSHDLTQKTVDVLALVLETSSEGTIWPSKDDLGNIIEFISHFVSRGGAKVSKELLGHIFEYLTCIPTDGRKSVNSPQIREKEILALLEVVPLTDWDDRYLLDMCEKAHFYKVCGFIYNSRHQYIEAIDSFMKDAADEPLYTFSYIHNLLRRKSDKRLDSLEKTVMSRIPDLVLLSSEGTFFLVVEHFFQEFQQILAELRSHPKSLFLYLRTVIELNSMGTVSFNSLRKGEPICFTGTRVKNQTDDDFLERISEFPKFLRENPIHVTDELTELYVELLCQYEPNSVLHFLERCESYRVDHCLRLCQEYGIIDAAAFLLERVGDVGTALSFTLSDLPVKFSMLDAAAQSAHDYDHFNDIMKKEVNDILHIVHACVGLCQRNSSRLDPNESEALWFELLDTFCEPLATNPSGKGLRKLFSIFIKEIVEGMIGYVRLPTVMMKLLSNNGNQEFGDFKATILGTLGTYDFERRILDTARSLIEDDTYYTMTLLKRGACHGHGPQSLVCFICNCLLVTKDGIRVYNCGHASHLHCEPASHTLGCPICMPKKKGGVRSAAAEDGLLVTRQKHKLSAQATGAVQEKDTGALDRQISRYEILSNLDKDKAHVDNMPHLRLAPPAVYQEKVKKGVAIVSGVDDKTTKKKKTKAAAGFPLKSNIFGKEKTSRR